MKIFTKTWFQIFMVALSVGLMQSCSCRGGADLDKKLNAVASDDTDLILVGNLERLFGQTGIEAGDGNIVLPSYLKNAINTLMSSKDKDDINFLTTLKGVDYNNAVVAMKLDSLDARAVVVIAVTNPSDLEKSLASQESGVTTEEIDGYKLVGTRRTQVVVKDGLGYMLMASHGGMCTGTDAVQAVRKWNSDAEKTPLTAWKKEYLSADRVLNLLITPGQLFKQMATINPVFSAENLKKQGLSALTEGTMAISANLDAQTFDISFALYDKDGKVAPNPYAGKFNTEMMKFATAGDIVAVGFAANQDGYKAQQQGFESYVAMLRSQPGLLNDYLVPQIEGLFKGWNDFTSQYLSDGGFFFAAGLAKDATLGKLMQPSQADFHIVLTADLKPESAENAYRFVCGQMSQIMSNATVSTADNAGMKTTTFSVRELVDYDFRNDTDVYDTFKLNVALDGNILVISNSDIVKGEKSPFNKDLFANSAFTAQGIIGNTTPVISGFNLPFGAQATITTKDMSSQFSVKVTDTDKHILDAVLSFLTGSGADTKD